MIRHDLLAAFFLVSSACSAEIGDTEDPELEETEVMTANAMTANAMTANALTAGFDANQRMAEVPLSSESYDAFSGYPELGYALHDSLSREFMKYLTSCALDSTQSVVYKDPFTSVTYQFKGSMGLCSEWGDPATGRASQECREVVSACLLARVNAYGLTVRLSQRGNLVANGTIKPIEVSDVVPAGDTYENGAWVGPLTKKCLFATTGAARECSWRPSETGYCTPGASVTVGLGAPPAASCWEAPLGTSYGADTILRACDGIRGCRQTDPTYLGQANNTCGTPYPSVTFTCPSSGFFTTMVGHNSSSSTPTNPTWRPDVQNASLGTEMEVFSYQEAAFYGNVFDASALAPGVNVWVDGSGEVHGRSDIYQNKVKGSIYTNMFACWSPIWNEPVAYATWRVCGGPTDENCAATPVGACNKDPMATGYPDYLCGVEDDSLQPGDGDFQKCDDKVAAQWEHAITVFLNQPCDVIPDSNICKNIFGITNPHW